MAEPTAVDAPITYSRTPLTKVMGLLAGLILLLQLAELYVPLAVVLRIDALRPLTVGMTGLGIICLLANLKSVTSILAYNVSRLWLGVIWLGPAVVMTVQLLVRAISLDDYVYWMTFVMSFGVMFLLSLHYTITAPRKYLKYIFYVSAAVAAAGFLVNFADVSFISQTMSLRSGEEVQLTGLAMTRLRGFYQYPNAAALAVLLLTFSIISSIIPAGEKFFFKFGLLILLAVVTIVTGSRTSMVLSAVIFALLFYWRLRSGMTLGKFSMNLMRTMIIAATGLLAISVVYPILLQSGATWTVGLERASALFDLIGDEGGIDDESALIRARILPEYIAYSMNSPVIGFGPQASGTLVTSGRFSNVSQNLWVQWGIEYGYVFVAFAAGVFLWTYRGAGKLAKRSPGLADAARNLQLVLLLLTITSFSVNTMFMFRSTTICTGFFIGLLLRELILERRNSAAALL